MVCRKSLKDVGIAIFVLTIVFFSFGTTFLGVFRYLMDIDDDKYINRDHLILGGNILQVAAIGGTIMIVLSNAAPGILEFTLMLAMFLILILVIYLTNFDPTNTGSQWTALILLVIDLYIKVTAILISFGVCSVEDVPATVSQMAATLMGGKRRR
jgi:hypothetical protein